MNGMTEDEIRRRTFDGLAEVEPFGAGINKKRRTIEKYIAQGMPTLHIGRKPYVVVDNALAWLKARGERDLEPRRPGRPKKTTAMPPRIRPSRESTPDER
jgi:hypothetical protein